MAQNTTVTVPEGVWTELTDANITGLTFLVKGPQGADVYIEATTGASPTADDLDGAVSYRPGQGERNVALSDLFPGVTGADRVWAYSTNGPAQIFVSHG